MARSNLANRLSDTPIAMHQQKVLIVDDQVLNRAFVAAEIEDFCTPVSAENGAKALKLANRLKPDLILMDINMPGLDGFEVCHQLKSNPHTEDIPIIFVSGMTDTAFEKEGLELGALDYIRKPFDPDILKARVRNQLQLQRQRRTLEKMSNRDGLTDIANRRYFDLSLHREWERMKELRHPLGLLMIDVDAFKSFNDEYGHVTGDRALKLIAQRMEQTLKRSGDLVARYGGEEFACILPHTDNSSARVIGDQLCAAVRDLRIRHSASPASPYVTVSIGCASVLPKETDSFKRLTALADQRLYSAKKAGRNRVVHC
ncbi:diguanylate cyclase domain-containing protein [Marinobacter zhejiangensis]|uniref:diguanylate cyclase n=1 Tax=Marinobacter zhejiangensis TaxID=488535 RepID=A0A1I4PFF6_9GAMM|nr:diguanylate cyclase [Marinobacter zhejiangensis]SFM26522.1 response regulator receiver modulated diguanylate cyclase [Marinobacter zhejiangensis]